MNCALSFEYEFSRDDDDFGWLMARLNTPDFSGRNGMWVQWQDLTEFAASLSRYPITSDDPITCDWGFGAQDQYIPVTKTSIAPIGATGGLSVDIYLANYYEPDRRCQTKFQTDYPTLVEFQRQIESMMRRERSEASLRGFRTDAA